MDKKRIARELVKLAKEIVATDSLIDNVVDKREVYKLIQALDEDEQTAQLVRDVYSELSDRLKLSNGEREALNRLLQSMNNANRFDASLHRNNIFKAAHALGIKLPSAMF